MNDSSETDVSFSEDFEDFKKLFKDSKNIDSNDLVSSWIDGRQGTSDLVTALNQKVKKIVSKQKIRLLKFF